MAMSRKDYRAVAAALHDVKPNVDHFQTEEAWRVAYGAWERACNALLPVFRADNTRFKADVFMAACFGTTFDQEDFISG